MSGSNVDQVWKHVKWQLFKWTWPFCSSRHLTKENYEWTLPLKTVCQSVALPPSVPLFSSGVLSTFHRDAETLWAVSAVASKCRETLTACCLQLCLFVSWSCQRVFSTFKFLISALIIQPLNLIITESSHPGQVWMVPCHSKTLAFQLSHVAYQSIHLFCN